MRFYNSQAVVIAGAIARAPEIVTENKRGTAAWLMDIVDGGIELFALDTAIRDDLNHDNTDILMDDLFIKLSEISDDDARDLVIKFEKVIDNLITGPAAHAAFYRAELLA